MLTQRQENFCAAYIETGNATEAYRRAYSTEGMKPATVNRKAKALIDMGKIRARIEEARAPVMEEAALTLQAHLQHLKELRDTAAANGHYAAAISAEIARGRAAGLYTVKKEISTTCEQLPQRVIFYYPDNGKRPKEGTA